MLCVRCGSEIEDFAFCPYCGKRQPQTPPVAKAKRKKRPNGSGAVDKVKRRLKKPWRARSHGLIIGYYATEKEAHDALARLVDADITEKYNWTFTQVYEAWKREHFPKVGATTVVNYESSYQNSKPLHNRKFRSLRSDDFQSVLDSRPGLSVNTVSKHKQLFTQMTAWAIANDVAVKDYASRCTVNGKEAQHHTPLSDADIKLIEQDGSETARVVLMLLATGMRIGELFALPLSDYHGDYVIGGEKTEAGRERIIPIRPEGRAHFEYFSHKAHNANATLLIEGYKGQHSPANFRKRDYYPLLDKLGIDRSKTPHSTRVTYGTRAASEDNLAPAVLQKVMGHSDFNTTQKFYNQPDAEALVKAVNESAKKGA